MKTAALKVTTPSERELVMTREFDASRGMVFDALTKPELVQRWLLGPPGWTMLVCEIDLRVGGKYRYVWRNAEGRGNGDGGYVQGDGAALAPRRHRIVWRPLDGRRDGRHHGARRGARQDDRQHDGPLRDARSTGRRP